MNELRHLDEFQRALANYHLSNAARQTLSTVRLVMLLGPTGGGRNTIINQLVKTNKYNFVVSDTTRQPRRNNGVLEQNGREYWFRTEEEMLREIEAGSFLEAEIIHNQQVSGISMRELAAALQHTKTAITDADVGGVTNALALKPETVAVLVLPPSFDEWQHRLAARGIMPSDELHRRLTTALTVFKTGLEDERFRMVINDDYKAAADSIQQLVTGVVEGASARAAKQQLCRQLIKATQDYLLKA